MIQLLAVVVATAAAAGVAALVQRSRSSRPVAVGYHAPVQVHRADFVRADAPWLVAVFSSATCNTCADIWAKCAPLESDEVAVHNVEYAADRALHDRYAIDAVPTVVIADRDGVVRRSFLGPTPASELWAALAELRDAADRPVDQ